MKLRPLNNQIVVKPSPKEEVTKSGIVLPETAKGEKPAQGEVVAIGDGKLLDSGARAPFTVKVGDKIMFKKYAADEIEVEGTKFLVLSENDVLAIIE